MFACKVAREAGALARSYFLDLGSLTIKEKGVQDMATEADVNTENLIRDAIAEHFPDDEFLGEESYELFDLQAAQEGGKGVWVVDPIDGTQPFVSGISTWCISLAYVVGQRIEVGVIYDPNNDEMFSARAGFGAMLNNTPMMVSGVNGVDQGLIGIGYSNRVEPEDTLDPLRRLITSNGMFHRCGSGALSIAYVASGRLIGYYEPHMNSWDAVAGMLLVAEAGGRTNNFFSEQGALVSGNLVLATGAEVFEEMESIVNGS
jgi:myo-inositol-1(or 4)-monophosphatase